jgi:hypothetical protein
MRSPLDRLYSTPPGGFIRERNALVVQLARARDPRALEVKAIPKPTIPVWVMNTLARERPKRIAALIRAGERMRDSRRGAHGRGGEGSGSGSAAVDDFLAQLGFDAAEVLMHAGAVPTADMLKRIMDGLWVAAVSGGDLVERLRAGRIEREPESLPLEASFAAPPSTRPRGVRPHERRPASSAEKPRAGRKAVDAVAQTAAAKRLVAAEDALLREERNLERLKRDVARAARHAVEARHQVDLAREALAAAKRVSTEDKPRPLRPH